MDFITDVLTGRILDWVLATPVGQTLLALAVSVVVVSVALHGILLGLRKLAGLTPWGWDDTAVGHGLLFTEKVLAIAREVVAFAPGPFKAIAAALKPAEPPKPAPKKKAANKK